MKINNKKILIIVGIVFAVILLFVAIFTSTVNTAITMEEQIKSASSSIDIQEKRRVDLVYNLADICEQYAEYEGVTLTQIAKARSNASTGNVNEAMMSINAVAEAYPELKANQNYNQLMTELSITENGIAEIRNNYNQQVRDYNKFVRQFPATMILNMSGYEKLDYQYLEYNAPSDAPQDLFGDK
jgi:LemA protein